MFRQFLIVCSAGLLVHVTACLAVCLHHLPYLPCPDLLTLPCPASSSAGQDRFRLVNDNAAGEAAEQAAVQHQSTGHHSAAVLQPPADLPSHAHPLPAARGLLHICSNHSGHPSGHPARAEGKP